MSTKKEYFKFKTPRGAAVYPKLDKPYTFDKAKSKSFPDPDGKYEVSLALDSKDADKLKADIIAWAKEQGVKSPEKLKNLPWKDEVDKETDEETGRVIFKFKQYGKNKDGDIKRIPHFDSKAQPIGKGFKLTSGSIVKLSGSAGYFKELGGGLNLSVNSVQVIKYVPYEAHNPFADEGDDGFKADDVDADDEESFDNETVESGEETGPTDF